MVDKVLKRFIGLVGIATVMLFCACEKEQGLSETEQDMQLNVGENSEIEITDSTQLENLLTESQQESNCENEDTVIGWQEIELTQTYRTCIHEVHMIPAPVYEFDYPDGWEIWAQEIDFGDTQEQVVLWNEQGGYITYRDYNGFNSRTSAYTEYEIEITKIADAQFQRKQYIVEEPDYENLIVAQIKVVGERPADEDVEYTEVDGELFFAIVPESYLGRSTLYGTGNIYYSFSFDYHGYYCLVADSSKHEFTEQEIQEIIAILHSFRQVE